MFSENHKLCVKRIVWCFHDSYKQFVYTIKLSILICLVFSWFIQTIEIHSKPSPDNCLMFSWTPQTIFKWSTQTSLYYKPAVRQLFVVLMKATNNFQISIVCGFGENPKQFSKLFVCFMKTTNDFPNCLCLSWTPQTMWGNCLGG